MGINPSKIIDVTPEQIREALIEIADSKGRPYFGLGVVREVVNAVKNNESHHLKSHVLLHIKNKLEAKSGDVIGAAARLAKLRSHCKTDSEKNALASKLGISYSLVNSMVKGRYEITSSLWLRIEPVLDQTLQEQRKFESKESQKKSFDTNNVRWG